MRREGPAAAEEVSLESAVFCGRVARMPWDHGGRLFVYLLSPLLSSDADLVEAKLSHHF